MANPVSYLWDFGNGKTSGADSPISTYTPGVYTVSLVVTFDDGSTQTITKEMYIQVADGNNNNLSPDYITSPKSLHFGWTEEHGFGWSENTGDGFVWPESHGSVLLYEANGYTEKIVWDMYTRKPYVINTRDSSHDSAVYTDRADKDGLNGTPIGTEITFPEFSGERKHFDITHSETNIRFRPEVGVQELSPSLSIDISLLIGDREEVVEVRKNVNPQKEVVFYYQNNKKGNSITNQLKVATDESKYQLMGFESYFRVNDRFKSAAKYTPDQISLFLNSPVVWRTRWDYSIDRATGVKDTNFIGALAQGPDFNDGSAVATSTTKIIYPAGNQSTMFWSKEVYETDTYGGAINGWKLYYSNNSVPDGEYTESFISLFDYRVFNEVLTEEIVSEYYSNLSKYLPR